MNDQKIKRIAAEALRNKDTIYRLVSYLRPEDVERGLLILPDEATNRELRPVILGQVAPYLRDYRLTSQAGYGNFLASGSSSGLLFLDLSLSIKQLGPIQARYMIAISECCFTETARRISFSYREDVKSTGNPLQAMALKALLGDRTLLMKAAELSGFAAGRNACISVNWESAYLDLFRLPVKLPAFLDGINLDYAGAGAGSMKFLFTFR